MKKLWNIIKAILSDILWLGIGVLFCLTIIAVVIVITVLIYNGIILDGSNPRFGG